MKRKVITGILLTAFLASMLNIPYATSASEPVIVEFPIPTPNSNPEGITTGFGSVWFTESGKNKIGKLDPDTGFIEEFSIPVEGYNPVGITAGLDYVWFTLGDMIGRLDPSTGEIAVFSIPTTNAHAYGITTGFDYVWFAGREGPLAIGRLDPATGHITQHFFIPSKYAVAVTSGFDYVWFTERFYKYLARFDPETGSVVEYPLPEVFPTDVVAGFGFLWLAGFGPPYGCNKIAKFDPNTGEVEVLIPPTPNSVPIRITTGYGYVWFTEVAGNNIGRIQLPPPPPVGGKAIPINKPTIKPELQIPWIWLSTIILPLVATAVYVKLKKKKK